MTAITLADIEAAAERIANRVRRTPCLRSRFIREELRAGPTMLKLECLQVTGAFKVRGATNAILRLGSDALARGVITASGGTRSRVQLHSVPPAAATDVLPAASVAITSKR